MEISNILLSCLPLFTFALSMPSTSEGPAEESPRDSTDLKLVWLEDLTMSLHLSDTTQLTILLSPASNIPGEPTPCLFSGSLEQDQDSVVAVTGCKDSPDSDVTIASRLVPGGLVDLVIVNGSTYSIKDDTSSRISRRMRRQQDVRNEDMVIPPASAHLAVQRKAGGRFLPSKVVLETYLRYDNTLLGKFGGSHTSTKQWLSRVVEMAKPRLLHSSLDTGVKLQLIGDMEHHNEDIKADSTTLDQLARNPEEKGLISYFGYNRGGGIAFLGTACRQDGYAVNINTPAPSLNKVLTAKTWVHELGHNIGMRHDFDDAHGGESGPCNNQGLMSYGNSPDKWSTCSNADFAAWFRKEGRCLKYIPGRCHPAGGRWCMLYREGNQSKRRGGL